MDTAKIGFKYLFECFSPSGELLWEQESINLIPDVGRDYIMTAARLDGSKLTTWYIGLYEANRTPVVGDTMTTLLADCVEDVSYTTTANARLVLTGALAAGVFSNTLSPASFVFEAAKTIYGGFITSGATRGSTTGTLLSAVKNATAKTVAIGDILRVTTGLSFTTV